MGAERQNKAEMEWFECIWLGPATGSSETLVGTDGGVVRASVIKRHDLSERWDRNALEEMQGYNSRAKESQDCTYR